MTAPPRPMATAALWSAVTWAALSVYGFLVTGVVYRAVGAGAFGVWATIGALRGLLMLFDGGLATSVSRDVALAHRGDLAAPARLRVANRWCVLIAAVVLVGGGLLAAAPGLLLGLEGELAAGARLATLLTAVETALCLCGSPLAARLRGQHRFDVLAWATVGHSALGAALLWPLTAHYGLPGAAAAALAARVAMLAVTYFAARRCAPFPPGARDTSAVAASRAVFTFVAPLWLAALLAYVGLSLDVPLVGAFFDEHAASAFALGARLPGAGIGLLFAIVAPSFPRLVQATPLARARMSGALFCMVGVLAGAGFAFLALHAELLLGLWVGKRPRWPCRSCASTRWPGPYTPLPTC